jgi:hypothetical protein
MANILSNSGIINGQQITVNEITQIIDVFTAAIPSDVTLKGEFFPTGSTTKIIASNGFIGSLYGTSSYAVSSSIATNGPLTYTSASYSLTSSVFTPLKTNTSTYSIGYTTNVTTGLISGYGQIPAGASSSVITGLTVLIGKSMDTTGRSGSVFISMFQDNSNGGNFDSNKVVIPYTLSSSNLTFQTLSGTSTSDTITFNYIITYV